MLINFRKKFTVALFILCMKVKKRYISICNMKSLWRSVWVGQQVKEKYQNGCHLKTTSQNHYIFDVHKWGTYVQMYTKYEVSMSNPVAGGCAQTMPTMSPMPTTTDKAWLYKALWLINQMSQKPCTYKFKVTQASKQRFHQILAWLITSRWLGTCGTFIQFYDVGHIKPY